MMRRDHRKMVLYAITILFLFAAVLLVSIYVFPPHDWENIPLVFTPDTSQKEPATQEITLIDNSGTEGDFKIQAGYHIIVGSFDNLTRAQQKAKELLKYFNANIIVLPPTPEGFYRISYRKYSTVEEAESAIKSIRTNISSDAWIFSERK